MERIFRVAEEDEIEQVMELRMEFIREFRPKYSPDRLDSIARGSVGFIREKMAQGLYTAFFGETDGKIACTDGFGDVRRWEYDA